MVTIEGRAGRRACRFSSVRVSSWPKSRASAFYLEGEAFSFLKGNHSHDFHSFKEVGMLWLSFLKTLFRLWNYSLFLCLMDDFFCSVSNPWLHLSLALAHETSEGCPCQRYRIHSLRMWNVEGIIVCQNFKRPCNINMLSLGQLSNHYCLCSCLKNFCLQDKLECVDFTVYLQNLGDFIATP